jgi:hypothetical protein
MGRDAQGAQPGDEVRRIVPLVRPSAALRGRFVAIANAVSRSAIPLASSPPTISSPVRRPIATSDCYDRSQAERAKHRALATLDRQGYRVTLEVMA